MEKDITYQLDLLNNEQNLELVAGDKWFIVNSAWIESWKFYIKCYKNQMHPGKIDNLCLLDNDRLNTHLLLGRDVQFVSEKLWNHLCEFYGCNTEKTDVFLRTVVSASNGELSLDLFPTILKFIDMQNLSSYHTLQFSSKETLGVVKCELGKKILDKNITLYDFDSRDEIRAQNNVTIAEASIDGEKKIYYSTQPIKHSILSNGDVSESLLCKRYGLTKGVCGLNNLGNTCFMNSAIQCISNVPDLNDYFLKDKYITEINKESRLGSKGVIAKCFAEVLHKMWSDDKPLNVSPRDLKCEIGKMAPQFNGFQQHDAHELLMFLLDFLHEDLNRIKKKPYIESKDANERPDDVVADETWSDYKKRNDSVIVDLFHGLLKSTVTCPTCNYISITFDPFSSLSLPLVAMNFNIKILPLATGKELNPLSYCAHLSSDTNCNSLINHLKHVVPLAHNCQFVVAYSSPHTPVLEIIQPNDARYLKHVSIELIVFVLPKTTKFAKVQVFQNQVTMIDSFLIPFEQSNTDYMIKDYICKYINSFYLSMEDQLCHTDYTLKSPHSEDADGYTIITINMLATCTKKFKLTNYKTLSNGNQTLYDCFNLFTAVEFLGVNNYWYCKMCKEHKEASKKMDLWSLPNVLIVQLKRFRSIFRMDKINTNVEIPITGLQLVDGHKQNHVYDLISVSNHMGGLGGGHYTAYAKNRIDNKWYFFNDSVAAPTDMNHNMLSSAYVLIFEKRKQSNSNNVNGDNRL